MSTQEKLKQIIARIEKLEEEKSAISSDIKDVFAEAKGFGFDVPVLRITLQRRKMDAAKLEERDHLVETYEAAISGKQLDLFEEPKKEETNETIDQETGEVTEIEDAEEDDEPEIDDEDGDGFEEIDDE